MIQEYQLRVLPEVAANEQRLKEYLVHEKGLNAGEITATRILKRSIDARQRSIYINLNVRAYLNEMPKEDEYQHTLYNNVEGKNQVVVVGAGPGGLFAALRLIELGLRPVMCGTWKGRTGTQERPGANQPPATRQPGVQLQLRRGRCRSLLGWQAVHTEQKARQCRQDSECLLPTWSLHFHTGRCASAHRYGQTATCY